MQLYHFGLAIIIHPRQIIILVPGIGNLLLSYWAREFTRLLQHYRLMSVSLVASIAKDTTHFGHRTQRIADKIELNASPQKLAFIVPESTMKTVPGWKQLIALPGFDTYEPQQRPVWHNSPKSAIVALDRSRNQRLSNWTQGLLPRREIIPATVNLASYTWLVKSRILEENL